MANNNIRTDLAVEMRELYNGTRGEIPGVAVEVEEEGDYSITKVEVLDEQGEKAMGKSIGNYITIECSELTDSSEDVDKRIAQSLSKELSYLIDQENKKVKTILIVGLGNWQVTPDSLGPKVIERILVTRHLIENMPDYLGKETNSVCAISPGVLGTTGIETSEIVEGVVKKINPDVIIAIDALASRRVDRINSTIQICDTGINPGSGVGNKRKALNKETLGVPVIAIGVPTVVDAATLANDTIDKVIDVLISESKNGSSEFYSILKNMDRDDKYDLIRGILSPYSENLVVTPKEIDDAIENISIIIAEGINDSLLHNLDATS